MFRSGALGNAAEALLLNHADRGEGKLLLQGERTNDVASIGMGNSTPKEVSKFQVYTLRS